MTDAAMTNGLWHCRPSVSDGKITVTRFLPTKHTKRTKKRDDLIYQRVPFIVISSVVENGARWNERHRRHSRSGRGERAGGAPIKSLYSASEARENRVRDVSTALDMTKS